MTSYDEVWKKKTDEKGNYVLKESGDYEMELVSRVEVPDKVFEKTAEEKIAELEAKIAILEEKTKGIFV